MRRNLRLFGVLLALAMVVAACAGDTATTTEAPAPATTAAPAPATTAAPTPDTTMADDMPDDEPMDLTGTTVTVFGPESSAVEAGALQAALDIFGAQTGIEIQYTGARDFSDQINAQAAGNNPPDIAVFPQPGKIADFAREGFILPLPAEVSEVMNANVGSAWTAFGTVDGTEYAIPTKADLKSLVWYQPTVFAEKGYAVPESWDELLTLTDTMIANGDTPWCVGIQSGPATGWPFTDWVEDLMLRIHGAEVYDQWVSHEIPFSDDRVAEVWQAVLDLWNKPGAVYAAGGSIALTPFGDNGFPLVDGNCMMHRQASFFSAFFPEGTVTGPEGVDVFYFPSVSGDRPVLGAGTLVAAFDDRPEVWEVMKYFASPAYADQRQRFQHLAQGGGEGVLSGFLSPNSNADLSLYQPLEQSFLDILFNAEVVRFDGSDLMPADVGSGTFWTEATSVVNGEKSLEEALQIIDDSWPSG